MPRWVRLEPYYRSAVPEGRTHRLYFGAIPVRPVDEIFSFFSCQDYRQENPGFARYAIDIGGHITPALLEGKKITRDISLKPYDTAVAVQVAQVTSQGLVLGTVYLYIARIGANVRYCREDDWSGWSEHADAISGPGP